MWTHFGCHSLLNRDITSTTALLFYLAFPDGLDDNEKTIGEMDEVPEGMLSPTGSSTGEKLGFPDAGGMLGDPTTPTMLEKRKQKRQRMGMGEYNRSSSLWFPSVGKKRIGTVFDPMVQVIFNF